MPNIFITTLTAAITAVTDSFKTVATAPQHRKAILDAGNNYNDLYATGLRIYSVFDASGYAASMGHDPDAFKFGHEAKFAPGGFAAAAAFIPCFIIGMSCEYLKIRAKEVAAEEIGNLKAISQKLVDINPTYAPAQHFIKQIKTLEESVREKQINTEKLKNISAKLTQSGSELDIEATTLFKEKIDIETKISALETNIADTKKTLGSIASSIKKDFVKALADENQNLQTNKTLELDNGSFHVRVPVQQQPPTQPKSSKDTACKSILCEALDKAVSVREFISHASVSFWIAWAFNYNRVGPRDNSNFKVNDFWTSLSELLFAPIIPTISALTNRSLAAKDNNEQYKTEQKAIAAQRVQTRKGQITFFIKQETEKTLTDLEQKQIERHSKLKHLFAAAANEVLAPKPEPIAPSVSSAKFQNHFDRNPIYLIFASLSGGQKTFIKDIFNLWILFNIATFVLRFFINNEETTKDLNSKPGNDFTLLAALICFVAGVVYHGRNNLRAQNKLRDDADKKLNQPHNNTKKTKEQVIDEFQQEIDQKIALIKTLSSETETLVDDYNELVKSNLQIDKNEAIPSIQKIIKDFTTFQGYFDINCKVTSFEKYIFNPLNDIGNGVYVFRFFKYSDTTIIPAVSAELAHLPQALASGAALAIFRFIESRFNQATEAKNNLLAHLDEFIYDKKCLITKLDKVIEILKGNRVTLCKVIQYLNANPNALDIPDHDQPDIEEGQPLMDFRHN